MSADSEVSQDAQEDLRAIERVLTGETEAFAELVTRYQRRVLSLGLRFFRSREEAEDFVQEVFLRAFRKLGSYSGSGRFYSWLMRIAYNLGCRQVKRVPDFDVLDEAVVPGTGRTPEETVQRREAQRAVVAAMKELPDRYSECIGLYYYFGLTYLEIAESTGYPVNTVRSHIRRARIVLATLLGDHGPAGVAGGTQG